MRITELKTYIQSANINFLFGSGLSKPYLSTLGNIEKLLTKLAKDTENSADYHKAEKASIYKEYFTKVIFPNYNPEKNNEEFTAVIDGYKNFLIVWNEIINKRANRLLSKQVNIYTTNIDTLVENALEEVPIEFNDGFKGSIKQVFSESNFQKSYSKTSLHFQNISEIPVFNYLKMHGSINWSNSKENIITNDYTLNLVNEINAELEKIDPKFFIEIIEENQNIQYAQLSKDEQSKKSGDSNIFQPFLDLFEKLIIVAPTKQKFIKSVIELHFYELMRIYSNSLEKENSVLFVMGFSFADEHIAKITLRAAKTNPTLLVVIFAYDDEQEQLYNDNKHLDLDNHRALNNNIRIITPTKFKEANKDDNDKNKKQIEKIKTFDLSTINSVFKLINSEIPVNYARQQ